MPGLARSMVFTVVMFGSVLPWSIVVCLGRLFGEDFSYRLIRMWARGILWLCSHLCGLGYRVEGQENLPSSSSIVLLKHSSAFETIAQIVIFPQQSWVLKRELTWVPFLGWALATARPISINRGAGRQAVAQVIAEGLERLQRGRWVMIFPEGTRVPSGETRKYGVSGVALAQAAGRPVVPVAHDAGDYWPRRGVCKRPGTVTFRIGPAIDAGARDPRDVNAEVQAWIEREVAEIRALPRRH